MKKLAIVTTHPVQYYAPVFELLHRREQVAIHVFYTRGALPEGVSGAFDPGFGRQVAWDIPLTTGYPFTLVENTASEPGSHHFRGIRNPTLARQLEDYRPDAILVYGWAYESHLQLLRRFRHKIPVWFRGDSTLLDPYPPVKKWMRTLLLRWVYRHVDRAFYVGRANKAYFEAHGLSSRQLIFAPHAVDNARFAEPRALEAEDLRRQLGIPADQPLVLFTGKFEPKKAPLLLIDAFLELSFSTAHLLLVGDGVQHDAVHERAAGHPNIHIVPFVNQRDIPVYYQACSLFCLPSAGPAESWGLAVNEAMAAGKAVLVSDKAGCAADLVENEVNGAIFQSQNKADLVQKLRQLLDDPHRLSTMGMHSQTKIQDYSFIRQVIAFECALTGSAVAPPHV